ncbi:MAG: hypothetical protein ACRCR9_01355 [Chitinophagaceae bacterium]
MNILQEYSLRVASPLGSTLTRQPPTPPLYCHRPLPASVVGVISIAPPL